MTPLGTEGGPEAAPLLLDGLAHPENKFVRATLEAWVVRIVGLRPLASGGVNRDLGQLARWARVKERCPWAAIARPLLEAGWLSKDYRCIGDWWCRGKCRRCLRLWCLRLWGLPLWGEVVLLHRGLRLLESLLWDLLVSPLLRQLGWCLLHRRLLLEALLRGLILLDWRLLRSLLLRRLSLGWRLLSRSWSRSCGCARRLWAQWLSVQVFTDAVMGCDHLGHLTKRGCRAAIAELQELGLQVGGISAAQNDPWIILAPAEFDGGCQRCFVFRHESPSD